VQPRAPDALPGPRDPDRLPVPDFRSREGLLSVSELLLALGLRRRKARQVASARPSHTVAHHVFMVDENLLPAGALPGIGGTGPRRATLILPMAIW